MMRTRVSIDTIVIDGAPDAQSAIASLRRALTEHLQAPIAGTVPPGAPGPGSIELRLPPRAGSTAIGTAIASATAGAVSNARRRR